MRLAIALLAAGVSAGSAVSSDCPQARAIYAEPDAGLELAFSPVESDAAVTSHIFSIRDAKTGTIMEGHVIVSDAPERTGGMVQFQCPEGDVTGADIEACTVWEGVIYALNDAGQFDLLPPGDVKAAEQILLPGFGPSVATSSAWGKGKLTTAPWDAFQLKGCANG